MSRKTSLRSVPNSSIGAVHVQPKNPVQDQLINAITGYPLTVVTGPAGVGKTYITVNVAMNLMTKGRHRRLILTRSNMPTGKSLGSFPGDIKDKIEPWLAPMISVAKERIGETHYQALYGRGSIQYQPLETIRGASFNDAVILVDEAQNLTYEEVKAITTRIGTNSKMVLMGDPMQKDIASSGLSTLAKIAKKHGLEVPVIEFGIEHIVRSDIVAQLVRAYIKEEENK